jgi:predicted nucleic acid-binding protein
MGLIDAIKPGARVYIDTVVAIYLVEKPAAYASLSAQFLQLVQSRRLFLHASEVLHLECLVHPLRRNVKLVVAAFEQLFGSPGMTLHPVSVDVLRKAAQLRAATASLRAIDAIHVATSFIARSDVFFTNDLRLRNARPGVILLDDHLTP